MIRNICMGGGGGDGFPYKTDGRARRLCVDVNRNLSYKSKRQRQRQLGVTCVVCQRSPQNLKLGHLRWPNTVCSRFTDSVSDSVSGYSARARVVVSKYYRFLDFIPNGSQRRVLFLK